MDIFIREITKLEELTSQNKTMNRFCHIIRNDKVVRNNIGIVNRVIIIFNIVFSYFDKQILEIENKNILIDYFADYLYKILDERNLIDKISMPDKYDKLRVNRIIRRQFDRINPYLTGEFIEVGLGEKKLMDIFEDIYQFTIRKNMERFAVDYSDFEFGRAVNESFATNERLTPNPSYRGINRWNPPNNFFVYLGVDRKNKKADMLRTCIEEIRCEENASYTFAKYEIEKRLKILDLSIPYYESQSLQRFYEESLIFDVNQFVESSNFDWKTIEKNIDIKTQNFTNEFSLIASFEFINYLKEEIFVPLTDLQNKNEHEKTIAYASFHTLANWLESHFDGVIYPSTRMKILNGEGECLVLFDHNNCKLLKETVITGIK